MLSFKEFLKEFAKTPKGGGDGGGGKGDRGKSVHHPDGDRNIGAFGQEKTKHGNDVKGEYWWTHHPSREEGSAISPKDAEEKICDAHDRYKGME